MDNKLVICIVIFALTLLSYIINKIPMWVTALLSLAALYITGCVDANGALGGFANVNTILMDACFMVASGFRRTSLVKIMCDWLLKLTNGSFMKVYFGYLLLGVLLTNFMGSPMVVYAIIGPLLCALCDRTGNSRSKYIFPLMVIVVACCFALPLPTSIQKAGEFNGYLETYQFTGLEFAPLDFFFARFPVIILCLVWAMTIGPKMCPSKAAVELAAAEEQKDISSKLSPMVDKIGMVIFVVTMIGLIFSTQLHIASWWIALAGSILMAMFGVVDQKKALSEIPWEMLILYAGALALGNGLVNTGAGDAIGGWLATAVGGTHNNYLLGALFFVIPFFMTQFMLNRSVQAVFVPICLLTCQSLGAAPMGLVMCVASACQTAFMTPMATPAVAMCMGEGGYDLKALFKSGWLICILLSIVNVVYTMTVYPAF